MASYTAYKATFDPANGQSTHIGYYRVREGKSVVYDWHQYAGGTNYQKQLPSRECYEFLGYVVTAAQYNVAKVTGKNWTESTATGRMATGQTHGGAVTLTAQWEKISFRVSLDWNGGDASAGSATAAVYGSFSSTSLYADDRCTAVCTRIVPPTYGRREFLGYFRPAYDETVYDEEDPDHHYIVHHPEQQCVNADGTFCDGVAFSDDVTLVAHWSAEVYVYTLESEVEYDGATTLYLDATNGKWYEGDDLTSEITAITPPSVLGSTFLGFFASDNTQVVMADGTLLAATSATQADTTITARFTRTLYFINFDYDGGTGAIDTLYVPGGGYGIYTDPALTTLVGDPITPPTKAGYDFAGCYDEASGEMVVGYEGDLLVGSVASYTAGGDSQWVAHWTPKTYTLTYDAAGGSVSPASKTVTYGQSVGALAKPTKSGEAFAGWMYGDTLITDNTVWLTDAGGTLVAQWIGSWGGVTDWFGLASGNSPLVCISSESGGGISSVETSHSGPLALQSATSNVGAYQAGGTLLNPTCTYRVKKSGTVSITLGKAMQKATSSTSGFMVASFEYATGADQEPTLTVTGTANEGANAVNQKTVSLAVRPDHIAQAPLGGVSGGGELVACTTSGICDSVVTYEGLMPCASDTVHHRIRVNATTAAYLGESAPAATSNFVSKGVSVAKSDVDFTMYSLTAERSI